MSKKLIEICEKNEVNYNSAIVTNGYYLNKDNIKILKDCKISYAQVTIDGDKETHNKRRILKDKSGTYDIIIDNILNASEKIKISIRINVDKNNISDLDKCLDNFTIFLNNKNVSFYVAAVDNINESCKKSQCFNVYDFSREEVDFYKKAQEKGYSIQGLQFPNLSICGAVSLNSLVIDPNGDIYKCWNEVGRSEKKVGNINSLVPANKNLIDWLSYDPFNNQECIDCNVFPICMGGCPYYPLNGNENKCKTLKYNSQETINLIKNINKLVKESPV